MKPGEIEYNFSKIEKSKKLQVFLKRKPSQGQAAEIDVEECKEAMREFSERFIRK